jgi:hypothetical protein
MDNLNIEKFLQELSNKKNGVKNTTSFNVWSRHNQNTDLYQQKNPELNNFKENTEDVKKREMIIEPRFSSTRALPITNQSFDRIPMMDTFNPGNKV